ncbi:hypothetical protein [Enterococcus gilvus]|uniref:hypothetical protein n=1 Tax=Enterococcus gilvus TaxID=160453 RepID=UPI00345EB24C
MDFPESPYSKELIANSEIIKNAISPTLAIVNEMNPVSESIRKYMEQNSIFTSKHIFDNLLIRTVEERNRTIAKMVPSSVLAIQNGLDFSGLNGAKQIADSVTKWDFSGITKSYKSIFDELPKNDFRIDVATQKLEQVFTEEP